MPFSVELGPLFDGVAVPSAAYPPPVPPLARAEALTVLRDWLLEREDFVPMVSPLKAFSLCSRSRELDAPRDLLFQAIEEAEDFVWRALDPTGLLSLARACCPKARVGLLQHAQISSAVAAHIDGLWVAVDLGLPVDTVWTRILGDGQGVVDELTLHYTTEAPAYRPEANGFSAAFHRSAKTTSCVQIELPRGWRACMRATGVVPRWASQDLPEGWAFSKHKVWLRYPLVSAAQETP